MLWLGINYFNALNALYNSVNYIVYNLIIYNKIIKQIYYVQ